MSCFCVLKTQPAASMNIPKSGYFDRKGTNQKTTQSLIHAKIIARNQQPRIMLL